LKWTTAWNWHVGQRGDRVFDRPRHICFNGGWVGAWIRRGDHGLGDVDIRRNGDTKIGEGEKTATAMPLTTSGLRMEKRVGLMPESRSAVALGSRTEQPASRA
jgi:hypothetical protein